jgi:hypothetical protein
VSSVLQQHDAGKTFEQMADAYGVDTARLLDEPLAIETAELVAAVKAGTFSARNRRASTRRRWRRRRRLQ